MRNELKGEKKEYFIDDPTMPITDNSKLSDGDSWHLVAYYKQILREHKDPFKHAPKYFVFKSYRLRNEFYDVNSILLTFEKHVLYRPDRKSPTNRKAIKRFYGFCLHQGVDWTWWLHYLWDNLLKKKEKPVLSHLNGDDALDLWNEYIDEHGHPHNNCKTHSSMKQIIFHKIKRGEE